MAGALAGLTGLFVTAPPADEALAHGGLTYPATRTYACYVDAVGGGSGGALNPTNPACAQALREGGQYAFYNWFGNLISDAAGRHREVIADGELCGPSDSFDAFNAPHDEWPTTELESGAGITFRYNAWAPHPGTWYQYVTKDGWDPDQPLTWDDLEPVPFDEVTNPPIDGEGPHGREYTWDATLPEKSGRHIIYSIWERSDSPEAFYNCSDVVFTGGDGGGDAEAPDAPGAPTATGPTADSVQLQWPAASDNVRVTGYEVRDAESDKVVASTTQTSARVTGLTPETDYEFTVVARDAAGNRSAPSAPVAVTTGGAPNPGYCSVDFRVTSRWSQGYSSQVTVSNTGGGAISGWDLEWYFLGDERVASGWSGTFAQSGKRVSVSGTGSIAPGASVGFGFNADTQRPVTEPDYFTLNGTPCATV
ncbi:cellulose-binding protein [Marinitenerispora sediminis]|uniref:Cellulose-binding protein n=1 Tax=Marinitenerispora sediminis TaxID=1931232 RepID=A0A368T092_9ACTN|nr:cellulose-binding protein [Marinitenerispora sediminis]RCV52176.1 cellulose-binding protein [Marinitenerispora sediminis]RCV53754.1 cellulose-binding protein [Marinitenerispora sediminis]